MQRQTEGAVFCIVYCCEKTKNLADPKIHEVFLAERKGFEPLSAFDTLHDFQSCALDQLSHLSTYSLVLCAQRLIILPRQGCFVKHIFKKVEKFPCAYAARSFAVSKKLRGPARRHSPAGCTDGTSSFPFTVYGAMNKIHLFFCRFRPNGSCFLPTNRL